MSLSLNSIPLVEPSRWHPSRVPIGTCITRASGKMVFRRTTTDGYRRTWMFSWDNLDPSDKDDVASAYAAGLLGSVTLVPPDGGSYTVISQSYAEEPHMRSDGSYMYTVDISVAEQS